MDRGFWFLCHSDVKRLLFIMAAGFALVFSIQYLEFPSSKVFSLFSVLSNSSNFFPRESSSSSSPPNSKLLGNSTFSNNSEAPFAKREGNYTAYSNEGSVNNFGLVYNETVSENYLAQNKSLALEKGGHSVNSSIAFMNKSSDKADRINQEGNLGFFSSNSSVSGNVSAVPNASTKKHSKKPPTEVFSIGQMNEFLQQSRASSYSMRPQWHLEVDQQLMFARSEIQNAADRENDPLLLASIYRNVSFFKRSYELMEEMLKVYIYQEGERPIFHQSILEGIYASEGWFIKLMEANKKFVTHEPRKGHLFYIPFSSRLLELTLYVRNSHNRTNLIEYMKNYTDMIAAKYPFWNRSGGADHFVVSCHDWAPAETRGRMLNCIRALCNADIDVGFSIGKDVSLPETYVRSAQNPLKNLGGNPPNQRPVLAFFAGNVHGFVRPILLEYWANKDPDMKIFGPMPHVKGNTNYLQYMKSSNFCICARGHEVNSPRIVESILYECVPVIISDNFIPPFFEVLNWESFAVFVLEKDIPNLKNILLNISEERYMEMHKGVKKVQQHFLWHSEPVKYDLFHMILHSVWLNRVFQMRPA